MDVGRKIRSRFTVKIKYFLALFFFTAASASAATPIKVLSFNVGTAHIGLFSADCDHFKLCHQVVIDRIKVLLDEAKPDVVLFQETQGLEQLFGTYAHGPVLNAGVWDAACANGVANIREVCVAWRRDHWMPLDRKETSCQPISRPGEQDPPLGAGIMSCSLKSVNGAIPRLDAVSVHGNTKGDETRFSSFRELWSHIGRQAVPTVVGGDFNTENCTLGEANCDHPAPAEFGTAYGKQIQNYGRWGSDGTYFGYRTKNLKSGAQEDQSSHSTHYFKNFDHIFMNFGAMPVVDFNSDLMRTQPCDGKTPWAGRAYFNGGFTIILGGTGWKTDHYPILACTAL